MNCRVLPHAVADGPTNMAVDHALLDAVDADPGSAVVRTYEWSEPTLSLGYFQGWVEVEADPRWEGAAVVRRPSGGGALWHHHEITYAIVVPRNLAAARRPSDLYRAVHEAIVDLLRSRGIEARRRGRADPDELAEGHPFLCFADRDEGDILVGGVKVVGGAQRRRPRAVLQHGSLLLRRSPATPELPGLAELAGSGSIDAPWPALLAAAIPSALGLETAGSALDPEEFARAGRLASQVYADPSWLRRR